MLGCGHGWAQVVQVKCGQTRRRRRHLNCSTSEACPPAAAWTEGRRAFLRWSDSGRARPSRHFSARLHVFSKPTDSSEPRADAHAQLHEEQDGSLECAEVLGSASADASPNLA